MKKTEENCSQNVEVCNSWTMHARLQDFAQLGKPSVETILSKLVDDAAEKHKHNLNCRNASLKTNGLDKFIIMTFDSPNKIIVPKEICYQERNFTFISQVYEHEDKTLKSTFKFQKDIYSSIDMKPPEKIDSILEQNILLVVYKLNKEKDDIWQVNDSPITYKHNSLANMNRRLNNFVASEKQDKRKSDQKELDKKRDQTPKRKAEHKEIDNKRNKISKRLDANKEIGKKRDQTPKGKEAHKKVDKKRDQTPKRKEAHAKIDKKRDQTPKRKEAYKTYFLSV